jgi:hypothetical protein
MPPDFESYHRSIASELASLKDRIRHLVPHWPTDGEHKEVALRALLRRHVGESVHVGRGFVVAPGVESRQIDVLVIDREAPTLFRDGDLFIVTPDAVRAVVEVKTKWSRGADATRSIEQLRAQTRGWVGLDADRRVWTGVFVYERGNCQALSNDVLGALATRQNGASCPVDCVAVGSDLFVRWWPEDEGGAPNQAAPTNVWRAYEIEGLAPSYFLGNLIAHLCPARVPAYGAVWFPLQYPGGKERFAFQEIAPGGQAPRDIP